MIANGRPCYPNVGQQSYKKCHVPKTRLVYRNWRTKNEMVEEQGVGLEELGKKSSKRPRTEWVAARLHGFISRMIAILILIFAESSIFILTGIGFEFMSSMLQFIPGILVTLKSFEACRRECLNKCTINHIGTRNELLIVVRWVRNTTLSPEVQSEA
jgi:hypothetical protein